MELVSRYCRRSCEVHRERGIIPVSRELESRLSCAIQCLKIGKYRQNYKLRVLLVLYSRESASLAVGIGSIIRYLRRYKETGPYKRVHHNSEEFLILCKSSILKSHSEKLRILNDSLRSVACNSLRGTVRQHGKSSERLCRSGIRRRWSRKITACDFKFNSLVLCFLYAAS